MKIKNVLELTINRYVFVYPYGLFTFIITTQNMTLSQYNIVRYRIVMIENEEMELKSEPPVRK